MMLMAGGIIPAALQGREVTTGAPISARETQACVHLPGKKANAPAWAGASIAQGFLYAPNQDQAADGNEKSILVAR